MKKPALVKLAAGLSLAGCLLATSNVANAAAFQLWEQNAAGLGDYHAGGAAEAADASTNYYNPAGIVRINHQQMVVGLVAVSTQVKFEGSVTTTTTKTGTSHGGVFVWIPNFHYVSPLNDKWNVGFSVVSPFGLATNYSYSSPAAAFATKTKLQTIDLVPSAAYKFSSKLSVGAGMDFEHMKGQFDDYILDAVRDSNKGSGWGTGWHAGILYQFTPMTRVGFAYHSKIRFKLYGDSKSEAPLAGFYRDHTNITLPATSELSFYHGFDKKWAAMASVMYTQWNVFRELTLYNVAPSGTNVTIHNYFHNSWNFAVGVHYHVNDKWMIRVGGGFDQTPIYKEKFRNLRLPDNDRYAASIGGHYQATKKLGVDFGWTHLFIKRASLTNNENIPLSVRTSGHVDSAADLVGVQISWNFT